MRTSCARSPCSCRSTSATTRSRRSPRPPPPPWSSRRSSTRVATVGLGHAMRALPEHRGSAGIAVTAPAPPPTPAAARRRRATFLPFAPPLVGQEEIDEVVDRSEEHTSELQSPYVISY